jgi:Fic family protein
MIKHANHISGSGAGSMKKYIWQTKNWQSFQYDRTRLSELLTQARFAQGELLGKMSALDLQLQTESQSAILIKETSQTAKIEGLELNINSVRSSVAARLGFPQGVGLKRDRDTDGLVAVLIDAVRKHQQPLTIARLNGWHAALFPLGYSGLHKITAGQTRRGSMQVVSGPFGREKIHFEAVPANILKEETKKFLDWFNRSAKNEDGLLRAAAAHLKFVTIHPYDDGNGRLARAITDMAMAQDEKSQIRAYSLSTQIMKDRRNYYNILEAVQSQNAAVLDWYIWFIRMFIGALKNSRSILETAFFKAAFWNKIKGLPLNTRQSKVLQRLLDAEPEGFTGGLTTRKYVSLTKTSSATAFREIEYLRQNGILKSYGQGRSVHYKLVK